MNLLITHHARQQMFERGIDEEQIKIAIQEVQNSSRQPGISHYMDIFAWHINILGIMCIKSKR